MIINSKTKISVLIKENEKSIDAIASINPHFNKLKNPILRKILASRVTIEDAARIGKCDVAVFFKKLAEIGFEIENNSTIKEGKITITHSDSYQNEAILNTIKLSKVSSLDVRPTLAAGGDPFKDIMAALKTLPTENALEVINTFEPTPLIKIVKDKGYVSMVKTEEEVVYTYFLKEIGAKEKKQTTANNLFRVSLEDLEKEKFDCKKQIKEIDVRDLEMPLPMVTILNELENLTEKQALFVHHKKVPQYLLPELEERNFKTWIAEIGEGNVKLLIHK